MTTLAPVPSQPQLVPFSYLSPVGTRASAIATLFSRTCLLNRSGWAEIMLATVSLAVQVPPFESSLPGITILTLMELAVEVSAFPSPVAFQAARLLINNANLTLAQALYPCPQHASDTTCSLVYVVSHLYSTSPAVG